MRLVADTSALVSLGTVAAENGSPLSHLLDTDELLVPERVLSELEETASYDAAAGHAAEAVLELADQFDVRAVALDDSYPLDDGENAAVVLANQTDATQLLCDEFNRLALVHASLATSRLVTTPTLLVALVRNDVLTATRAETLLEDIGSARSWAGNAYVERARETLRQQAE